MKPILRIATRQQRQSSMAVLRHVMAGLLKQNRF
jgi:hypothetical protein